MTLADLGDYARNALHSVKGLSADQTPSRVDGLLKRVNAVVMLFDDRLYDLRHGNWVSVEQDKHDSQDSQDSQNSQSLRISAKTLSAAAARLLGLADDRNAVAADNYLKNVLLLLPPAEFLATPVNFPGIAPTAVRAALQLQASTLLPAWDKPLSIAVHSPGGEDNVPQVVLHMPSERLDQMFEGFAERGLFLALVAPRPLILNQNPVTETHTGSPIVLEDRDSRDLTRTVMQSGKLTQYLYTALHDLDDAHFADAWKHELAQQKSGLEALAASEETDDRPHAYASAEDYLAAVRRQGDEFYKQVGSAYLFCPAGALAARHQFDRGKRMWRAAALVAGIAALSALPFLLQTIQIAILKSTLETQLVLSAPARANQAEVRDFESQWGVILEFPRQQVPEVMRALQAEISPSVLAALEIEDGFISIEGDSADPQNLLQQLEENPLFTEVDFARATNNNRYFIDLRLTTVNFPAYQEWYFPERR
jgi:hypothetical protein